MILVWRRKVAAPPTAELCPLKSQERPPLNGGERSREVAHSKVSRH